MGQYYSPVCIDAKEYINTWDYKSGLKLMEHSWLPNPVLLTVMNLIAPGGRWHKQRLVWAGDYGDDGLFLEGFPNVTFERDGEERTYTLHSYADKYFAQIKPKESKRVDLVYIINHDKGEYVDLTKVPDNQGWKVHPLSLLTSNGNGRGGGDYHNQYPGQDYIGTWAGDHVSSSSELPVGFTEIQPDFIEVENYGEVEGL